MKDKQVLVRCEKEDQTLLRWGAQQTKLEQSEVVRQAMRIGIPILVRRMQWTSVRTGELAALRQKFKGVVKMQDILKATEEDH